MAWIWNFIITQSFQEYIRSSDRKLSFFFLLEAVTNIEVTVFTLVSSFSWSSQEASSCCSLAYRKERRLVTQQGENHTEFHFEILFQRLSQRWLKYIRHDFRCLFDGGVKPSSILCSCLVNLLFSTLSAS